MSSLSAEIVELQTDIAAFSPKIRDLSAMQSTAVEVPEVRIFSDGDKSTQFLGPDEIAKAIERYTRARQTAREELRRLESLQFRRSSGGGVRRTGVTRC